MPHYFRSRYLKLRISTVDSSRSHEGSCLMPLSCFSWFTSQPWLSLSCKCTTWKSAFIFTEHSPCVSVQIKIEGRRTQIPLSIFESEKKLRVGCAYKGTYLDTYAKRDIRYTHCHHPQPSWACVYIMYNNYCEIEFFLWHIF